MTARFEMIWSAADAAGRAAAAGCTPNPMVVGQKLPDGSMRIVDVVEDGPCGFAYVKIRPANSALARWLKGRNVGFKAYEGGWDVSIHDYGQSWERKTAHARAAAAAVLRSHGVNATSHDRLD